MIEEHVAELHEQIQNLEKERDAALSRISDMECRLARLERVDQLSVESKCYFEIRDSLEKVKAITRELFDGEIALTEREDCEIEGDRHFTFSVADSGDLDDMLARYKKWHARLGELPSHVRSLFRLSIDARP